MAITVKQLMDELRHYDPDKKVVAVQVIKGGYGTRTEFEMAEGGQDAQVSEEFDEHVFIWVGPWVGK